jgi:hypothetical protein
VNPELPTPSPLDRKQGFLCARYIDFANSLSSVVLEFMGTLLTTLFFRG